MAAISAHAGNKTCSVFSTVTGAPQGSLVRFVVGENAQPVLMQSAAMNAELDDPFANLLLKQGVFPATGQEVLAALDAKVEAGDPLAAQSQRSFVLGEGSQIPLADATPSTNAGMRFLVTRGSGANGPDIIISAAGPNATLVELMAWDAVRKGFNYYRTVGKKGRWAFAGNSRHALSAPTKGKGPFESHPSGNLLMKELKLPWVHWHSSVLEITPDAFPQDDLRRSHPWFTQKQGAERCEIQVVMPSIRRWTSARLDQVIAPNGTVTDPKRIIEQVVKSPTVNLASSKESAVGAGTSIDLPPSFFVDVDGLAVVGLPVPTQTLAVSREIYQSSLSTFAFKLKDGQGFVKPGDTHFAFVVPERAFEDTETLRQAIARGLITKRLAAALLMVGFPNPVFSPRRAALLAHAPSTATITGGTSTYSTDMADAIIAAAAAPNNPAGSPEKEFVDRWTKAADLPGPLGTELTNYYGKIGQRLQNQADFNNYVKLAESHRNRVREMPIFESRLLFPETNIPAAQRRVMKSDGAVVLV
jgi:hypothetical protein